jgi:hypothetical protein
MFLGIVGEIVSRESSPIHGVVLAPSCLHEEKTSIFLNPVLPTGKAMALMGFRAPYR